MEQKKLKELVNKKIEFDLNLSNTPAIGDLIIFDNSEEFIIADIKEYEIDGKKKYRYVMCENTYVRVLHPDGRDEEISVVNLIVRPEIYSHATLLLAVEQIRENVAFYEIVTGE